MVADAPQGEPPLKYQGPKQPEARAQSPERSVPALATQSTRPSLPTSNQTPARPSIQVRYTIIKSREPKVSKLYWDNGALQNKTVAMLFAEISTLVGRTSIERIGFQLIASASEFEYVITRGDENVFADMCDAFSKDIKADRKATGNTQFEIWVEPDPVKPHGGPSMDNDDEDLVF